VSDQPPTDDVAGPPVDAKPGDTWSLDPRPTTAGSFPAAPEGALPITMAEVTEGGEAAPPAPRRGLKVAGIALAAVLVLVGAAGAAAFMLLRGSSEAILDKVPASADVVVTANLDPAASQKLNLYSIEHLRVHPVRGPSLFKEVTGRDVGEQDHLNQSISTIE